MSRVQLNGVSKLIGGDTILKDIELDIRDRELFVLVGPSGCGKTTLLRLIAGLDSISKGDIVIDKRTVNDDPPMARNVAMVFQSYALYPHMTVYENMAFGLRVRGYSEDEVDSRVRHAAELLDLMPLLDRRPREISGGQCQRVAVGRAIVRKPRVFLLDEPFSNLDAKFRAQTRSELLELHRRLQTTMIFVTHDQVEAMTLGDRICVMREGRVQQVGTPQDLYQRPLNRFVAEFIGSPSMNFFPVTVSDRGDRIWLDQGHFQVQLPPGFRKKGALKNGQEILMGIRPEDFRDRLFETGPPTDGSTLIAVVRLIEPLGAETLVHLEVGNMRFVARLSAGHPLAMNQPVELILNVDKVHLFSRDGEERIHAEVG